MPENSTPQSSNDYMLDLTGNAELFADMNAGKMEYHTDDMNWYRVTPQGPERMTHAEAVTAAQDAMSKRLADYVTSITQAPADPLARKRTQRTIDILGRAVTAQGAKEVLDAARRNPKLAKNRGKS